MEDNNKTTIDNKIKEYINDKTENKENTRVDLEKYLLSLPLPIILLGLFWLVFTVAAFIKSISCFSSTSTLVEKIIGMTLAIILGPIYFIYLFFNKSYCNQNITNNQLRNNEVRNNEVRNNEVRNNQVRNNEVRNNEVRNNQLRNNKNSNNKITNRFNIFDRLFIKKPNSKYKHK